MAFTIRLNKTKTVTVSLNALTRRKLGRSAVLLLCAVIALSTAWAFFSFVIIPVFAPQPLKPEEIKAIRSDIDRQTLNDILLKNKTKKENVSLNILRDPFR